MWLRLRNVEKKKKKRPLSFPPSWESQTPISSFPVAQRVKNLPAMQETWVWFLGWDDALEKEMATHSGILAWKIPWTEEPGRLQYMGSQRVGHDWATNTLSPLQEPETPLSSLGTLDFLSTCLEIDSLIVHLYPHLLLQTFRGSQLIRIVERRISLLILYFSSYLCLVCQLSLYHIDSVTRNYGYVPVLYLVCSFVF